MFEVWWSRSTDQTSPRTHPSVRSGYVFPAFLVGFFLLWALRATVGFKIDQTIASTDVRLFYGLGLKALLWLVPAVAYVRWIARESAFQALRMASSAGWKGLTKPATVALLYLCIVAWDVCRQHSATAVGLLYGLVGLGATRLVWTVLSAAVEELFFRGLLLGEFRRKFSFWSANATSGLLFVLIHWPHWVWTRDIDVTVMRDSAAVLILALLLGSWRRT